MIGEVTRLGGLPGLPGRVTLSAGWKRWKKQTSNIWHERHRASIHAACICMSGASNSMVSHVSLLSHFRYWDYGEKP